MSRVNKHYNGYIVKRRGLDDLRDMVLMAGTTNFVTDASVDGEKPMPQRIKFDVGTTNETTDIYRW
jgi:hypothetical protein